MIHRIFMFALMLLFCTCAIAGQPVVIGESQRLHSAVLGEDREYQVSLPASYAWAQDRRYPVLYVLDGRSHFIHTTGSTRYLAAQGEIPEMIVVAVASTVRVRDFTQSDWSSHWVGGGGAANFRRFLSTELIPEIEKNYRVDGYRVLSGHSAGGQFALYCLGEQPALFQAYFALAPSLDWDDNLPQRSLQKSLASSASLKAFLYVARSDDHGQALADYDRLVQTLREHSPRGFRWDSQAFPEETHVSVPLLGQIAALRSLYAGYRFHDMAGKDLAFAQKHYQEVSARVGIPIAIPENVINDLGYEALSQGRTADAISLFKRNVAANPNSANAYDSLADSYAEAKQWQEAVQASQQARELGIRYDLPNRGYLIEQAVKHERQLPQARKAGQGR